MNAALRRRSAESTTISLALERRKCTTVSTTASTTQRIRGTFGSTASGLAGNPSNVMMRQSPQPLVTTIQLQTQWWITEWETMGPLVGGSEMIQHMMSLDLVFQSGHCFLHY